MVELTDNLLVKDSPIVKHQGQISSFQFDYENEQGVISSSKIRNAAVGAAQIGSAAIGTAEVGTLSFNQISGGTATLGGTLDGNGLLTLLNAGGTEVVRLDNTGITITAGTISNVSWTTGTITTGTINNSVIGTPAITGGTATSIAIRTSTIGTSTLTGGTVNPSAYQSNGTAGVTGTFTYLNAGTVPGTIIVMNGIVTTIS